MKGTFRVVCDGGKKKDMTYGSFMVFNPQGKLVAHHYMFFGFGTSNTAEYLALINSVDYCQKHGMMNLIIQSDSLLVIQQIKGVWKTYKPHLKKLRGMARTKLSRVDKWRLEKITGKQMKKILGH